MKQANSILKSMLIAVALVVGLIVLFFAVKLLMLKQDVGEYREYWRQQAVKPAAENALYYVAFGDSVAQGLGASRPDNGYVSLVAKELSEKTGRPVHVINLSVSGARIQDIPSQLKSMRQLSLPADTVYTLSVGANDMSDYEESEFREQLDSLLSEMPGTCVVADIAYFGSGRKRNLEPQVKAANDIIKELVARYELKFAPLYETTRAHDHLTVHSIDFFHPSDKGHRNWANAFLAGLDYAE